MLIDTVLLGGRRPVGPGGLCSSRWPTTTARNGGYHAQSAAAVQQRL